MDNVRKLVRKYNLKRLFGMEVLFSSAATRLLTFARPAESFLVTMKDGAIYKNAGGRAAAGGSADAHAHGAVAMTAPRLHKGPEWVVCSRLRECQLCA